MLLETGDLKVNKGGKEMKRVKFFNFDRKGDAQKFLQKYGDLSEDDAKKISQPLNLNVSMNEIMAIIRLRSRLYVSIACICLIMIMIILYFIAYNGSDSVLIALLVVTLASELALLAMYRTHAKKEAKKIAEEIIKNKNISGSK